MNRTTVLTTALTLACETLKNGSTEQILTRAKHFTEFLSNNQNTKDSESSFTVSIPMNADYMEERNYLSDFTHNNYGFTNSGF